MSRSLSRSVLASTFARSFLVQGSWNYRTMLGSGFAFAMLPALRSLFGGEEERMDAAVARHLEHFNAHPYLANVALGAVIRLEADGADEVTVRRFKEVVRGPLGSLGDALVWATWLPGIAVMALALHWFGLPSWVSALAFVVIYNVGHIGLRVWGFRAGLESGRDIGLRLQSANLAGWTARLQPVAVGVLGVLVGAVLGSEGGLAESGAVWLTLAALGFVVGLLGGHQVWRPAAVVTVASIVIVASIGVFR